MEWDKTCSIRSEIQRQVMSLKDFAEYVYTLDVYFEEIRHLGRNWLSNQDFAELEKKDQNFCIALYKSKDGSYYFMIFTNQLPPKLLKKVQIN